ncbi:hypothetical protein ABIB37_001452 [Agrococcus sp. UYP10]|uniref:hypothetical protein n=1 Tax=Agrococcus sp. UYP10 TaxID=1756355 RepID=UPI0033964260
MIIIALVGGAALTGCSSSTAPESSGAGAEVSDATTCEAFGDVLTITGNADIALDQGRIGQQEHDGWERLATRVLDRVPTTGEGAVSEAITQLRDSAPPIALGAAYSAGIGSTSWNDGIGALLEACQSAGSDLATEAFTGG